MSSDLAKFMDETTLKNRQFVYDLINLERARQIDKFGFQDHPLAMWNTISVEEGGEIAKEVLAVTWLEERLVHAQDRLSSNNRLERIRGVRLGVANDEPEEPIKNALTV